MPSMVYNLMAREGIDRFWFPTSASDYASSHDTLFWFIFWVCAFFFALIVVLMTVFIIRYRHREGHKAEDTASHNTLLEIAWSVPPLILVIVMFYWGFKQYLEMQVQPAQSKAATINVVARTWYWQFDYGGGVISRELHVPVGQSVQLIMTSEDYVHSLFVPELRIKQDVVPGRVTRMWFKANKPGVYPLYCAEYCGTSHSDMITALVVHPMGEYERWLAVQPRMDELTGEQLFAQYGCTGCHGQQGEGIAGKAPNLTNIWNTQVQLQDQTSVLVDDAYLRESITDPQAKVVEGYPNNMPLQAFSAEQVTALVNYIKELNGIETEAAKAAPGTDAEQDEDAAPDDAETPPGDGQ